MRSLLRRTAEFVLTASGVPALARRRPLGTLVLAYHNIVPDDAPPTGDRSLHLPLARFRAQLAQLARTHEVVSLDDLDAPPRGARPRAAITFDDAYAGALGLGLDALAAHGMPATIFVAPGLLGRDRTWWDALAAPGTGLAEDARRHALEACRGAGDAVLAWAADAGLPLCAPGAHARIGTAAELQRAAARPGVTLALHTWSHPNLARLDADETREELVRCREWLAEHVGPPRPWLAYPYGLHAPHTEAAARSAGVERAFLVTGGWTPPSARGAWTLPRLNVPSGLSDRGFLLRASGIGPG
jgi:peptidoglycan/xylan/chitin deacetylase (PgdA/CDA1 family)